MTALQLPEDAVSAEFKRRLANLEQTAESWLGYRQEPEHAFIRDLIFLMVALGDQCDASRTMMKETAAQCRKDTNDEIRESRKLIGEGVRAVETLKQVNEKTVDAHLAKLLIRIGKDISDSVQKSVELGNKRAALEVHFRTVLYGSIIFCLGFVFGHVM